MSTSLGSESLISENILESRTEDSVKIGQKGAEGINMK